MSDISKADLKKEIQEILKDADLDNTSAKKVRLELQEKLECDLTERKKEVDNLVMEVIDEQTQEEDGSGDEEEESPEEESEEENSEEEKPKPKKKAAAKPAPKKKAAKKAAESDDDGSNFSDEAEEEGADSDGGGSDYEPDEPVKINRKRPAAKGKAKRRGGSDDDSSGEEWGSAKKKKGGARKKKAASDSDSDEEKPKKKRKRAANGKPNAYTAPVKLSEDLADIVGGDEMPRHEVVKRMWTYIKENNLQDPKNKQMIKCDEKLSKIVPTKKFRGFGMTKYLKDHMNVDKPKKVVEVNNSEDEDSD